MLERIFFLSQYQTRVRTEILAGCTTYLTMAYVIFVNPDILAQAGMDKDAVFVATCLAAALGCFFMGFVANLPVALAPGMGLNAFFTYSVVLGEGHSWQIALGAVFLSGLTFMALNLLGFRQWLVAAIPMTLRKAIAAGIGTFMALIALANAGIIVTHPETLVTLGEITSYAAVMSIIGFFIIIGLASRGIHGAAIISIIAITLISLLMGEIGFQGVVSMPPSLAPTYLQLDIAGALDVAMLSVIGAFLFVDLFDTTGTLVAVTDRAGLTIKGQVPNLSKALMSDSVATVTGACLGTSTTTSYIESATGVSAGGKTGLTAVTVGGLFLLSVFFSPLAAMIPSYATTGAIFYVAVLMLFGLRDIDWQDLTEASPVAVVLLLTPLTYSIADGISLGFITYALAKASAGKFEQISIGVWVLSALFAAKFIWLG